MKLVDILARELSEWPEGNYFAWQDYDREIRFSHTALHDFHASILADDHVLSGYGGDPDYGVTRAEWQAAVDALNAPKVVEWDGVGLPPVGLDVEVMQGGLPSVAFDWEACKILAINIGSDDKPQVITRDFRGDAAIYYPGIDSVYFRNIRTAEQVAAEEREVGIQAIHDAYTYKVESCTHKILHSQAARLYDAGCRLQVEK